MSDFLPAYSRIAASGATQSRTAVVLHGILGSRQNWRSFLRGLSGRLTDWQFIALDHRQHGDSRGAPEPHDLTACADDVDRLMASLALTPDVVIGHSFGSKVALAYADRHSLGLSQVWMLDAAPGAVELEHGGLARHEVVAVIKALRRVPQPLAKRQDVVEVLTSMGFSGTLARWMTTNLRSDRSAGGFVWRFDLDGVEALLHSYLSADMWPFVEDLPLDLTLHVVRGGLSTIWSDDVLDRLASVDGAVRLHQLDDAGHWLHADAPLALAQLLAHHLSGA